MTVRLIDEYGSEVSNNVDDSEHKSISREHGKVGCRVVVWNRSTSVSGVLVESSCYSSIGGVNHLTLFLGMRNSRVKEVVDLVRTVLLDVNHGDHGN